MLNCETVLDKGSRIIRISNFNPLQISKKFN